MQNQDTINVYFSKLKTLFNVLFDYESNPNCVWVD